MIMSDDDIDLQGRRGFFFPWLGFELLGIIGTFVMAIVYFATSSDLANEMDVVPGVVIAAGVIMILIGSEWRRWANGHYAIQQICSEFMPYSM
jgi:hypothetical protein